MHLAERRRQAHGDEQETGQIERLTHLALDNPIQRFAARIPENEDFSTLTAGQGQRLGRPRRIELARQRVFVFEPAQALWRGRFSGDRHRQDRHLAAALVAAVEREIRPLAQRLQNVRGILRHSDTPRRKSNRVYGAAACFGHTLPSSTPCRYLRLRKF